MSRANRVLQVCINGKYEWQIRALKEWASWHYIDELLDRQKDENNTNHQQAEIQVVLNGIIRSQTTLVDDIDDEGTDNDSETDSDVDVKQINKKSSNHIKFNHNEKVSFISLFCSLRIEQFIQPKL